MNTLTTASACRRLLSRAHGGRWASLSTAAETRSQVQDDQGSLQDRIARAFQFVSSPAVCRVLAQQGFAVVDGALGPEICSALRDEIKELASRGNMHLNSTHLVPGSGGPRHLLQKADIYEAELSIREVQEACPTFAAVGRDTALCTMLSLGLPSLRLTAQSIKLQYNAGGGASFPMHVDSDEAVDSRRVTVIAYLNPDWRVSHGGQLRLYPFPGTHVDVPPLDDRVVLLSTCRMLHRVLPSNADRYCFTTWLSHGRGSMSRNLPSPVAKVLADLPDWLNSPRPPEEALSQLLEEPEARKQLAKVRYAEEWARSLRESHPESPGRDLALQNFQAEVKTLRAAFERVLGPDLEELLRQPHHLLMASRISWF